MTELQVIKRLMHAFPGARVVDVDPFPIPYVSPKKRRTTKKKAVEDDALRGAELPGLSSAPDA